MILITGVTGLAGSAMLEEFVRQKRRVRVLLRDSDKAAKLAGMPEVDIAIGDMALPDTLGQAFEGVKRVLMISGPTMDMVGVQCAFIDAARAAGVQHLVKFSGLDSRPDSKFRFVRMHYEIEQHLADSGMGWTNLRPAGFMQAYLRELPGMLKTGVFRHALGSTRLAPVDLLDVGKVAFALLTNGGYHWENLSMTGPEALTMSDIAEAFANVSGRPIRYENVSARERSAALLERGIPPAFVEALDEQLDDRLDNGAESRVVLSTHARFGIEPTNFASFAERTVLTLQQA